MENIITGNIVDIRARKIFYGHLHYDDLIQNIEVLADEKPNTPYILPGFIDSHIHIESSMLVPSRFAELAVVHGTVATISDPHEIANVCGLAGVEYMIADGKTVPLKFHFGAPSCVPATIFETAGSVMDAKITEELLQSSDIYYLSEMMNFPGVLNADKDVMAKIAAAKRLNKPVDGHAPGLMGTDAEKYIKAGISTDHECVTAEEALHKLNHGMKILIREGSAAKNFDALAPLIHEHYTNMMFCSDDKHPDSLQQGHINELCKRARLLGVDIFKILQVACLNPVTHYSMRSGTLLKNDPADFIVVEDLTNFNVLKTFIDGTQVSDEKKHLFKTSDASILNNFGGQKRMPTDFEVLFAGEKKLTIIQALDGQLITNKKEIEPTIEDGKIIADIQKDYVKIAVVNRYNEAPVSISFLHNTGLKEGAIASTVAHDSHNIVVMGISDKLICQAVNNLIECKGGITAVLEQEMLTLPLPVAGLMSTDDGNIVAENYTKIDAFVKEKMGSTLSSPFMTLSFMALPVIPHIKLTDKGLFDVDAFKFMEQN